MTAHESWGIVFPGQGSQSVGMLSDIAAQYPIVKETVARASEVLQYDLWEIIANGPKETLDQTERTQPALLTLSYALYQLLDQHGQHQSIDVFAGHSLGEYSALVATGALLFEEAVKLVAARGRYMQEAVADGVGSMAAIVGLPDEEVKAICESVVKNRGGVLTPANFNSIGQVVIAGDASLVNGAMQEAKAKGAKLVSQLPVSVPSHCALMQPAADRLKADLAKTTIQFPIRPVVSNVTATPYQAKEEIIERLTMQLYSPVRWVETIQLFSRLGIKHVIECGPGKVLSGLIKRIDKSINVYPIGDLASLSLVLSRGFYAT